MRISVLGLGSDLRIELQAPVDILSQLFDVIKSDVALHSQVY